jgi:hypothetical protein
MSSKISPVAFAVSLLLSLCCFAPCRAQQGGVKAPSLIWDERGKYGFIDASGRVIIKPQFDGALPFTEGLAAVSTGNKWGFIDASGKTIIPMSYRAVSHFSDGLSAVTLAADAPPYACGYIDHAGQFVIKPQHEFTCRDFNEGFAVVGVYDETAGEDLDSYINKKGELAINGQYALAEPFSEGLARVNDFSQTYFINREGATVINLKGYGGNDTLSDEYVPAGSFSEGLAEVGIKTFSEAGYSLFGFVDKQGRIAFKLPPQMRTEGAFQNGRALIHQERTENVKVRLGRGETIIMRVDASAYGYIDAAGRVVIPARFGEANDFSEGLAVVRVGKPEPSNRRDLSGSAAEPYFNNDEGRWRCINRVGRVVIMKCGEPLAREELDEKFPEFGKGFGEGFVNGLFFNKIEIGARPAGGARKTVYAYMDKRGSSVWTQPHGKNVVPPKWWRENFETPR